MRSITTVGNEVNIETYSRLGVPIGPARTRNVLIAFLLSLVAGIGLAFLLDFLDDTVKSVDDIDRYIHSAGTRDDSCQSR